MGKVISFDSKKKEYEKRHMYNCFNEEERRQLVKPQIISGDFHRLFKTEIPVTVCGQ